MIKKHNNQPLVKCKFITFVLMALLTACNGSPKLTKIPIQTPVQTPIISTTAPLQKAPSATLTATPKPTATVSPTNTARPPTRTSIPCPPFAVDNQRPDPDIVENYIGRHYDTSNLPEGLENIGGSMIRQGNSLDYGLTNLKWTENCRLWWLKKLVCRNQAGKAYFEIVDAIASPPLHENETVADVCFPGDEKLPITARQFEITEARRIFDRDIHDKQDEIGDFAEKILSILLIPVKN